MVTGRVSSHGKGETSGTVLMIQTGPDSTRQAAHQTMSNELFRNEERDREDAEKLRALQREQRINLKAFGMTIAVVIAPFLALLFSVEAALFVLTLGLAFTTWLTWSGASMVGPVQRSRLKTMAVMNAILMLAVLGILALRLST